MNLETYKNHLSETELYVELNQTQSEARLLREPDFSLRKAIDICRAAETSETQMKTLSDEKSLEFVRKK